MNDVRIEIRISAPDKGRQNDIYLDVVKNVVVPINEEYCLESYWCKPGDEYSSIVYVLKG